MKAKAYLIFQVWSLFIFTFCLIAGTTGKISGIVADAESGEPLPGANIVIEGIPYGASTDLDGFYYILNIPPGSYMVTASYVGYTSESKIQVRVGSDVTTKVEFKLSSQVLETETITVLAERPQIQKDLTSSMHSVSGDEIATSPVEDLTQLLETQAGLSLVDATEKMDNILKGTPGDGLHIRGGRENETAYLVDGVRVDNPMWGGAGYTQNTSGSAVTEMMTVLGTFNAEYGGKMSGIINLVTKEGSKKYGGKISGYTDNFGIEKFDRNTFQSDITFSGPVPFVNNLAFFANHQYRTTDGRFAGYQIPNWTDSKGKVPIVDENGKPVGKEVSAGWKDERNSLLKLTWRVSPSIKLMVSYVNSEVMKVKYYHVYKYLPNNMPWSDSNSDGITLKLTHQLSASTFYELAASYQYIDYWMGVHKTREQRIVLESRQDTPDGFYYTGAYNNYWADTTKTYQLIGNIISQITPLHLLKGGFEFRYLDLFHRLENAWSTPEEEIVIGSDDQGNPITFTSESHKAFTRSKPIEWAVFVQDKMEFDDLGMILNAGLRLEQWSIGEKYMDNPNHPFTTPLILADPKIRLSPRLGISYPVSDKAAFHFAYGHFYQYPSYVNLLSGINDSGRYPGRPNLQDIGLAIFNPNINPEKSVTYEAGVQTIITPNLSLHVTAFYRELADLIGVTWIRGDEKFVYFDNVDFGNSKGLEFTLNKRFSNNFSGRINYTLSQTLTSTSSPLTAAEEASTEEDQTIAYRSFLADWDRTHDISALLRVSDPKNWAVSLKSKIKSGKPYTVMAERANTARMPWYIKVDMKLSKYFNYLGLRETLYLQIFNLFDRKNIYSVYNITGKWDDDGDPGTSYAHDANPRRISDGRQARIGINISF